MFIVENLFQVNPTVFESDQRDTWHFVAKPVSLSQHWESTYLISRLEYRSCTDTILGTSLDWYLPPAKIISRQKKINGLEYFLLGMTACISEVVLPFHFRNKYSVAPQMMTCADDQFIGGTAFCQTAERRVPRSGDRCRSTVGMLPFAGPVLPGSSSSPRPEERF